MWRLMEVVAMAGRWWRRGREKVYGVNNRSKGREEEKEEMRGGTR